MLNLKVSPKTPNFLNSLDAFKMALNLFSSYCNYPKSIKFTSLFNNMDKI